MTESLDWPRQLAEEGTLTGEITEQILLKHGSRGRKAIEAVGEARVKKYNDFIVVVGYGDEYIIENGECDCKDVRYNLDQEDPSQRCWHALAYEIAKRSGAFDEHDLWYAEVHEFI